MLGENRIMAKRGIKPEAADSKQKKKIDAIAKVSAQLFSTQGYLETSMEDIAVAAKITKGGVYHYFGSKTDILYYISSTYADIDRAGIENAVNHLEDVYEKIRFIIFTHIDHYVANRAAAKTLLHESYSLPPALLKQVRSVERQYFDLTAGVVSEFLGEKSTKELATTLTFSLFGMMNWIYHWYNPRGSMKSKELSELIYDLFVEGVKNSILESKESDQTKSAVTGANKFQEVGG